LYSSARNPPAKRARQIKTLMLTRIASTSIHSVRALRAPGNNTNHHLM
jgi:hypothetical protein